MGPSSGRVYDPVIGRFQTRDPFIDGIDSSQGPNGYAYVWNNPLSRWDPTGYGGRRSGGGGGNTPRTPQTSTPQASPPQQTSPSSQSPVSVVIGAGHAIEAVTTIVIAVGVAPAEVPIAVAFVAITALT